MTIQQIEKAIDKAMLQSVESWLNTFFNAALYDENGNLRPDMPWRKNFYGNPRPPATNLTAVTKQVYDCWRMRQPGTVTLEISGLENNAKLEMNISIGEDLFSLLDIEEKQRYGNAFSSLFATETQRIDERDPFCWTLKGWQP